MAIALFPGTFDPITQGHVEIIERALLLFDSIIIGVGINSTKTPMFPVEQRLAWISEVFAQEPKIRVMPFTGLTVHFAKQEGAKFLLRGLRASPDFEYEKSIDLLNRQLESGIETLYFISSPATGHISSTLVREVIRFGGRLDGLVPSVVSLALSQQSDAAPQ